MVELTLRVYAGSNLVRIDELVHIENRHEFLCHIETRDCLLLFHDTN